MPKGYLLALAALFAVAGCQPAGDPQVQLKHAVAIAKEQMSLPRTIDEHTELIDVQLSNDASELLYICRFHEQGNEQVHASEEQMKTAAIELARTDLPRLQFFIEHRISLTYVYQNEQGEEIVRYTLEPWQL